MKLVSDSEKALIMGLQGEKKHLEMNLEETVKLKEQFQKKCDQIQEMYDNLFKEAQTYKRQMVGVEEIKKDRDRRLEDLRQEIEALKVKYDKLNGEHAQLQIYFSNLKDEHGRLNDEYAGLSKHLKSSEEARKKIQDALNVIQKDYRIVKESLIEKDLLM